MATLDDTSDPDGRLIAASEVQGSAVYDPAGQKLGTVQSVLIDKVSGRIAYAVLAFGGFLGIGDSHHPMPWQTLRYDPALRGYVVDLDRETLQGAPVHAPGERTAMEDEAFGRRIHDYYGAEPFWSSVP